MCISLMNATACIHDIQMDTAKAQSTVITEIRLYPAEGPMPRASEALFALVDIYPVRLTPYSACSASFLARTVFFSHNNSAGTVFSANFSQISD